jgi:hypothetical protein
MAYTNFDWKPAVLAALREVPVLRHATDATGVHRDTVLKARKDDPEFDKAYDEAMEAGVDKAEQEAFRRAVVGFEEPVIHQGAMTPRIAPMFDADGEPVIDKLTGTQKWAPVLDERGQPVFLTVRKHSDSLLSLVLKGRRKKVYADRTELTGADGGPVATTDATQRAARAATLLKLAQARKTLGEVNIDDLV